MTSDITGTVTGIQNVAVSSTAPTTNQVLQYNGSQWVPANLPTSSSPIYGYEYATSGTVSYSTSFTQVPLGSTGPSSNTSYSSNNIVAGISGTVKLTGVISGYDNSGNATDVTFTIAQNGTSVGPTSVVRTSSYSFGIKITIVVDIVVSCSVNDTFGLYIKRDTGGNSFVITGASLSLWGTT